MANYKTKALSDGTMLDGKKEKHKYEIIKYLGRGGFGITYLAKETVTVDGIPQVHKYTIKEFCLSDICNREADGSITVPADKQEEFIESKNEFRKEAEHLKELNHPGIVPVSEVFERNNTIYYVMQFLGDTSLLDFIQQHGGKLDEETAIDIIRDVATSLQYLHERKMTHLDVKPDNIMMVGGEAGKPRPVLIDFGLSCHYGQNGQITAKVTAVGASDGYSPIEQYVPGSVKTFTPQADIYALGATLFHLLTGRKPVISSEMSTKYLYKNLPDNISEKTLNAIVMAMQKDKEDRPNSMGGMLQMLGAPVTPLPKGEGGTKLGGHVKHKDDQTRNYLYVALAVIAAIAMGFWAFQKCDGTSTPTPGGGEDSLVTSPGDSIVNEPEPAMASLSVSTTTAGTQIYVNGQLRGTSSWTDNLSAGTYRVEGRLQGYNSHSQSVTLSQGDNRQLTIPALKPIEKPAPDPKEKDLGYAVWYGPVTNGKPNGEGKMVFKSSHIIDSFDPDKHQAENGDYVKGEYQNGHLVQGNWYGSDGNKKEYIYIGVQ